MIKLGGKSLSIIFVLYFIYSVTAPNLSYFQSPHSVRIHGRVTDAATGNPLHFVNVFLSNTTKGAATDRNGLYSIVNVSLGNYELVVSMIGYKREIIQIQVTQPIEMEYNIQLVQKPLEAPELLVTAKCPKEWKKNLNEFYKYLFGTSQNASKCKILNPEVLDFTIDEISGDLIATTEQPIFIENNALGYKMHLHLIEFSHNSQGQWRYLFKSKFEPMNPKNEKEQKNWMRKRLEAFHGSFRHFLNALISGRLNKEGFKIKRTSDLPFKGNLIVYSFDINPNDLILPGGYDFEKMLTFDNYLEVQYTKEMVPSEYPEQIIEYWYQTSWIKLQYSSSVKINTFGYLYDPYAVHFNGYWSWERLAEALPIDFTPYVKSRRNILSPENLDLITTIPENLSSRTKDFSIPMVSIDCVTLLKHSKSLALDGNVKGATEALYEGLKKLGTNAYSDTLYWETFDIMSTQDRNTCKNSDNKGEFFLNYWQRQDITLATLENERYVEHQKRLDFAKKWFSNVTEPRGYDDRGMIYIRHGPPDERLEMESDRELYPNECWVYRKSGTVATFDFINSRFTKYELLSGLRKLGPGYNILKNALQFTRPRVDLAATYAAAMSDIQKTISENEFYAKNRDPRIVSQRQTIPSSLQKAFIDILSNRYKIKSVTTNLIRTEKPLKAAISYGRFYPHGNPRLEIYCGVDFRELVQRPDSLGNMTTRIITAYSIRDSSYSIIEQKTLSRVIRIPKGVPLNTQIFIDQINHNLSPGKYIVSVIIKDITDNRAFEKNFEIDISQIDQRSLNLSDIELAYSIEPFNELTSNNCFVKEKLSIMPCPFLVISRKEPINLYFEIYNLTVNANGTALYNVEYKLKTNRIGFLNKINPFSRKTSLSSSYDQEGRGQNTQEYFSLDFEKVKLGEYSLTVKVEDKITRESRTAEIQIKVVE